jgi:hypothetical protein
LLRIIKKLIFFLHGIHEHTSIQIKIGVLQPLPQKLRKIFFFGIHKKWVGIYRNGFVGRVNFLAHRDGVLDWGLRLFEEGLADVEGEDGQALKGVRRRTKEGLVDEKEEGGKEERREERKEGRKESLP